MGVVRVVRGGNLGLPFLLMWGAAFGSAERQVSILPKEVEQVLQEILVCLQR